jgi:hypothetical protein
VSELRCDEKGRVRYLSESESRRGQGMGTDGGCQPEGLERGYKCFVQVAPSVSAYRVFHLTNSSTSFGACLACLLIHHSILPRPSLFVSPSIQHHCRCRALFHVSKPCRVFMILRKNPRLPVLFRVLFASHLAPQTLSSHRLRVCVHLKTGLLVLTLLYPPRIHTCVPQPTMRYCMMGSSLRQGDTSVI